MPEPIVLKKAVKLPFREIKPQSITTIELDDVGLIFNSEPIGPIHPYELPKVKCTKEFRLVTMPELVQLACACLENQRYESARKVVDALHYDDLPGANVISSTRIFYSDWEGMFVHDNPEIREEQRVMKDEDLEVLRKSLGFKKAESSLKRYEKIQEEVIYSDDRKLRFTPRVDRSGEIPGSFYPNCNKYSPLEIYAKFSNCPGVITIVSGRENVDRIVSASEHCNLIPCISRGSTPIENIITPGLNLLKWSKKGGEEITHFLVDSHCWGNALAYTFEVREIK